MITLSAIQGWTVSHMDVKNTFLHEFLKEQVYMNPPSGYYTDTFYVCKLKKSLYGLIQAPRAWFDRFK